LIEKGRFVMEKLLKPTLLRASQFSLPELTAFWNLGYTDYFVPIIFSEAMFARWMKQGAFDLDHSLVLMSEGELVGFSFLGVRNGRGWIGGFGIAPAFRGQGHAARLFADHVNLMRDMGLDHAQLEVITRNWAQKVYARAGFATTRTLSVFNGPMPSGTTMPEGVSPAHGADLLTHHARLHASVPACWQRESEYLLSVPPVAPFQGLFTGPAECPTGYLVYAVPTEGQVRIVDAAASGEAEAGALVTALAACQPGATVTLSNEPQGSPLNQAMLALGVREHDTQYEMHWQA
jgi:ribosomal protein S18 acetylase RimI-like enzyme